VTLAHQIFFSFFICISKCPSSTQRIVKQHEFPFILGWMTVWEHHVT